MATNQFLIRFLRGDGLVLPDRTLTYIVIHRTA